VKTKVPLGVKTFLPRPSSVHSVEAEDHEEERPLEPTYPDSATQAELEVALAHTQIQSTSSPMTGRPSWGSSSRSPSQSVVSIPTRGWTSPSGSVMSEPIQKVVPTHPSRVGVNKPPICFLCYGQGHFLAECPRLPPVLQKEAANNREAFQRNGPQWSRPPPGPPRTHPQESANSRDGHPVPVHMIEEPQGQIMSSVPPPEGFVGHQLRDVSENAEEGS
jgi:hypothetical protein